MIQRLIACQSPRHRAKKLSIEQVASFRDVDDAQQLRAVLLLQNLPELSSSNVKGQLWHRVLVGPFTRKLDAERARTQLREQDLPAILMRDKS